MSIYNSLYDVFCKRMYSLHLKSKVYPNFLTSIIVDVYYV